jgi:cardiolipin synthase (CMP-forming)
MNKIDMAKLPNYLTYARIAAIPVIMLLLLSGYPALRWLAFVLYVGAAVTDYFDGYLARKYGTVSAIGRMLDPIADKLLVGALLIVFAFDGSSWATKRSSFPCRNSPSTKLPSNSWRSAS